MSKADEKKITGIVIREYEQNNNSYKYQIEDKHQNRDYYVTFGGLQIMMHYTITAKYKNIKNNDSKYPDSKNIFDVKYNEIITDIARIKQILHYEIKLSEQCIGKLIDSYDENTFKIIIDDLPSVISENNIKSDDASKLKRYVDSDVIVKYTNFFNDYSITYEAKWYNKLQEIYKGSIEEIERRPYDLLSCKISFKIVDEIGCKLGFHKHPDRIMCVVTYIFKKMNNDGLLYIQHQPLEKYCQKLNVDAVIIMELLICVGMGSSRYYTTPEIYYKERCVELFCNRLLKSEVNMPEDDNTDKHYETGAHFETKKSQNDAIKMILDNNLCIVTGPPGTGKTYIVSRACQDIGDSCKIIILALAGAAVAKIRSDVEKYRTTKKEKDKIVKLAVPLFNKPKYQTIHLFVAQNQEHKINHSREKVTIFIDEMSMVGLDLFHKLITIISEYDYLRLVLIGDKNQLPSIDGGDVLRDAIRWGGMPVTELNENMRSKENPEIMEEATNALHGYDITFNQKNMIFIESTKTEIEKNLVTCIEKYGIKKDNSCVIIPQRKLNEQKNNICTDAYNIILQNIFNENGKHFCKTKKIQIRQNDLLIQRKNNNKKEVYNGSILTCKEYSYKKIVRDPEEEDNKLIHIIHNGSVKKIKNTESHYRVNQELDHRLKCIYHIDETNLKEGDEKNYEKIDLDDLDLGYAMTVHSAQGKGYPLVVIIIHSSMYNQLLTRKMLYTAITRTKEKCIIIGDKKALEMCKKEDRVRKTSLFKNFPVAKINIITSIGLHISSYIQYAINNKRHEGLYYFSNIGINFEKLKNLNSQNFVDEMKKLSKILYGNDIISFDLFYLLTRHNSTCIINTKFLNDPINKTLTKKQKLKIIEV